MEGNNEEQSDNQISFTAPKLVVVGNKQYKLKASLTFFFTHIDVLIGLINAQSF